MPTRMQKIRKGIGEYKPTIGDERNEADKTSFVTSDGNVEVRYYPHAGEVEVRYSSYMSHMSQPTLTAQQVFEISIYLQGLRTHLLAVLAMAALEETEQEEASVEEKEDISY